MQKVEVGKKITFIIKKISYGSIEWGPAGWFVLHSITFGQPEHPNAEQAKHIRQFFTSLGYVLPCKRCGEHYRQFVEQNPIPADDREKLTKWLVRLHNNANASAGPAFP